MGSRVEDSRVEDSRVMDSTVPLAPLILQGRKVEVPESQSADKAVPQLEVPAVEDNKLVRMEEDSKGRKVKDMVHKGHKADNKGRRGADKDMDNSAV